MITFVIIKEKHDTIIICEGHQPLGSEYQTASVRCLAHVSSARLEWTGNMISKNYCHALKGSILGTNISSQNFNYLF